MPYPPPVISLILYVTYSTRQYTMLLDTSKSVVPFLFRRSPTRFIVHEDIPSGGSSDSRYLVFAKKEQTVSNAFKRGTA